MKARFLCLSVALVFILSIGCGTAYTIEARASKTLSYHAVEISEGSSLGEIDITYDVQASKIADKVGVSSIKVYKSDGSYVTTITGTTRNGLVDTDTNRHRSTYTYQGTSGVSYYFALTVFATIGSDSDSRTVTTDTNKAP